MTAGTEIALVHQALRDLWTRVATAGLSADPLLADAVSALRRTLDDLTAPVTIALAGAKGAGKTALARLLLGADLPIAGAEIPVMLEYGDTAMASARWLDGSRKDFAGHDLASAVNEFPDYLSLTFDAPVLQRIRLVDVSGVDHPEFMWQSIDLIAEMADLMLWCSPATDPLSDDDRQLIASLPDALVSGGILVLTKADQLEDYNLVRERMGGMSRGFPSVLPIATALAVDADKGGNLWAASGAERLISTILNAVKSHQMSSLTEARNDLLRDLALLAPALKTAAADVSSKSVLTPESTPAPETVAPVAAAKASPQAQPASPSPVPAAQTAEIAEIADNLVAAWRTRFDKIRRALEAGAYADNESFVTAAQIMIEEFLQDLAEPDLLPLNADWVFGEFERANDLLILLQFETNEGVAADAAKVLLQLDDSIRVAAVSRNDAAMDPNGDRAVAG